MVGKPQKIAKKYSTRSSSKEWEKRMKGLSDELEKTQAEKAKLETQLLEAQERLHNFSDPAENEANEANLKKVLDKLAKATETEESLLAQIEKDKAADLEESMDVDQVSGSSNAHATTEVQTQSKPVYFGEGAGESPETNTSGSPKDNSDGVMASSKTKSLQSDRQANHGDENGAQRPSTFDDFTPVQSLNNDEEDKEDKLLEGGTTILRARLPSERYLVSFGPKNSAMLTWQSASGSSECNNLSWLHGPPHKFAMETDDTGALIHKGKIQDILMVAWLPKRQIRCMKDLLDSVEELNPENKTNNPEYIFPFSTVLVSWKDDGRRSWLIRSAYKSLTSKKKDIVQRTDRKFYAIGCLQVRRYVECVGGQRIARESVSPTPLPETPEPEGQTQGISQLQNGQLQNDQRQNDQRQNDQRQNDHDQRQKTFSQKEYIAGMKEDLELDALKKEDMGAFIEQMALVRAKFDVYKSYMLSQGATLVV